jgi:hypothetical protein
MIRSNIRTLRRGAQLADAAHPYTGHLEGILLVLAAAPAPLDQIRSMIDAAIPVVYLDRVPENLNADSIPVRNARGGARSVEHLIANGYRRIAIATGPLTLRNEAERLAGCREALESSGLSLEADLVWAGNFAARCRIGRCVISGSPIVMRGLTRSVPRTGRQRSASFEPCGAEGLECQSTSDSLHSMS